MTIARVLIVIVLGLAVSPALAQRSLTPEEKADSDQLRALIQETPQLSVDRVELRAIPSLNFESISAVAADRSGNIYVLHRPEAPEGNPVVVLDGQGQVLRSWGAGMYGIPHGIRIDPAGNVWTIDANLSKILKFTAAGKKILEIDVGDIPDPERRFCGATDVAFGTDGRFYVSDGYCNGRVVVYSADCKKIREWGSRGTGPGEFNNMHSIALGRDGTLYTADRENGRLQWFDLEGNFLGQRKFGGQLFSVSAGEDGNLHLGVHPRGGPYGTDSHILKFNPASGDVIGKVEVFAHQLNVGADGTLFPGTINTEAVIFFRPRD